MAFVNIIDGTSETPSASTPGWQLDMCNRTTLSRASLGVPVRMWVCATNTSTGDTGAVLLVDSTGATVLSLLVNGDSTDTWYFVDGYIPATDAKYDVMIGGTTAGTMKVLAVNVGEYTTPGGGILLSSIGEITMSATGTVADTWTVDATSGIAVPADATEWAAFIASNGLSVAVPDHLWLCQEGSGNLSDSIGSLTLTATGSPQYSQSATGWSRGGVGFSDGGNMRFAAASGTGPSAATTSSLWNFHIYLRTESGSSRIIGGASRINQSNRTTVSYSPSGGNNQLRCIINGPGTTGAAVDHVVGTHVHGLLYDRTNTRSVAYSELDKIAQTYAATIDGEKGLGSELTPDAVYVYCPAWEGSNAEISDATQKALWVAQGYSISAWS